MCNEFKGMDDMFTLRRRDAQNSKEGSDPDEVLHFLPAGRRRPEGYAVAMSGSLPSFEFSYPISYLSRYR